MAGLLPGEALDLNRIETVKKRLGNLRYFVTAPDQGKPIEIKIVNRRPPDQPYGDVAAPDLDDVVRTRLQKPRRRPADAPVRTRLQAPTSRRRSRARRRPGRWRPGPASARRGPSTRQSTTLPPLPVPAPPARLPPPGLGTARGRPRSARGSRPGPSRASRAGT